MKKIIITALFSALFVLPTMAQNRQNSRYYNPRTGHLDYGTSHRTSRFYNYGDIYGGLKVGANFATVNSDDPILDGGSMKSGLNIGAVIGAGLSRYTPLYFETGLFYTEKGGKSEHLGNKFTYSLDYLEVPLLLKYKFYTDNSFSIQPYLGGYLACGVGGKIKNFGEREAYPSFSDKPYSFQRFDGGIKMGVGAQFDFFYADLSYDLGLSNISHDDFDTTHTGTLSLNVGFNF